MNTNEILKQLRQKRNLTQSELALKLDVSLSSYQKYERDKNSVMPSLEVLGRIADFYGVSVDRLLGRTTKEQDAVDELADEFNMSALEKKIVNGYLNLPESMRTDLMEFLHKAVNEVLDENGD